MSRSLRFFTYIFDSILIWMDQWAVGAMGVRTSGLSEQRAVPLEGTSDNLWTGLVLGCPNYHSCIAVTCFARVLKLYFSFYNLFSVLFSLYQFLSRPLSVSRCTIKRTWTFHVFSLPWFSLKSHTHVSHKDDKVKDYFLKSNAKTIYTTISQ